MAQCNFCNTGFGFRTTTICIMYIHDLPELTKYDTFLLADDIKIFRTVTKKLPGHLTIRPKYLRAVECQVIIKMSS